MTSWLSSGEQPHAPMAQLSGKSSALRQQRAVLSVPPVCVHSDPPVSPVPSVAPLLLVVWPSELLLVVWPSELLLVVWPSVLLPVVWPPEPLPVVCPPVPLLVGCSPLLLAGPVLLSASVPAVVPVPPPHAPAANVPVMKTSAKEKNFCFTSSSIRVVHAPRHPTWNVPRPSPSKDEVQFSKLSEQTPCHSAVHG